MSGAGVPPSNPRVLNLAWSHLTDFVSMGDEKSQYIAVQAEGTETSTDQSDLLLLLRGRRVLIRPIFD